jgi:archaemetzincin
MLRLFFNLAGCLLLLGCWSRHSTPPREPPGLPLLHIETALRPLATPLRSSQPGDWLSSHPETGQTFAEYIQLKSKRRDNERATIYLCLLGDFSKEQLEILEITQRYLSAFYQAPVELHRELPLDVIPEHARRLHPSWGTKQIHTNFVLTDLLRPERPDDAIAYLCFTSSDLFSSATENFVLGEAQTWERVGVWSIHRNGDPTESPEAFRQCLRRTMHIATHETGHILALKHCTAFACNMNGANSVSETDRHPLHFCPICVRKLLWNLDADAEKYLADMQQFCRDQQFDEEARWYADAESRLRSGQPRSPLVPGDP